MPVIPWSYLIPVGFIPIPQQLSSMWGHYCRSTVPIFYWLYFRSKLQSHKIVWPLNCFEPQYHNLDDQKISKFEQRYLHFCLNQHCQDSAESKLKAVQTALNQSWKLYKHRWVYDFSKENMFNCRLYSQRLAFYCRAGKSYSLQLC